MKVAAVILAVVGLTAVAIAAERQPWYMKAPKPINLKAALAEEKRFLGEKNVGYNMKLAPQLCASFEAVGLSCDYNTRGTLSMFLTVYGKSLFPASGGTNPYVRVRDSWPDARPDDVFIGTAQQNKMLSTAVTRNAGLFRNGNLTAEDVKRWH